MTLVFLGLLAGAAAVLISPVRIWVDFRHRGKTEDSLLVQVSLLWGLGVINLQVPKLKVSGQGVKLKTAGATKKSIRIARPTLPRLKRLFVARDFLHLVRKSVSFFGKGVKITKFVWHTEIGLRDSAALAQSAGALWAVKGMVCAGLSSLIRFSRPPVFRVLPHFNRSYFRMAFTCILEFTLGYAIIAAMFSAYLALKFKLSKRGDKNVGTSNPGSDEDSDGKHQRNGRCQYSNR